MSEDKFLIAREYRLQSRYDEALKIYQELIDKYDGEQYDLVREKAHTLSESGNYQQAIPVYELCLSLYPPATELKPQERVDLSNTYVGLARAYSEKRNFDEAHNLLEKARKECPDNSGRIKIEKALIYIKQNKRAEAKQLLEEVYSTSTSQKIKQEALFRLGYISTNVNVKQALEYYSKADQQDDSVLFNIANCYLRLGKYDAAKEYYKRALEMNRESSSYLFNNAKMFELNGQYEDAKEEYERTMSLLRNKNDEDSQQCILNCKFSIGNCELHIGNFPEAIKCYQGILDSENKALFHKIAIVYFNKGMALYQSNDINQAQVEYLNALDQDPSLKEAQFQLGCILVDERKYKEAIDKFKISLIIDTDNENDYRNNENNESNIYNAKVHNALGFCHTQLNQFQEAHEEFRQACELDKNNHQILCNFGVLETKMDKPVDAQKKFDQAQQVLEKLELDNSNQLKNQMIAINSLQRISKIQNKIPSDVTNKAGILQVLDDEEEKEKDPDDSLTKILKLMDLSREKKTQDDVREEEMRKIQERLFKYEQVILNLQNYNNQMVQRLQQQDQRVQKAEFYQKRQREEINDMSLIMQNEDLHDYYNAVIDQLTSIHQIALTCKQKQFYNIQVNATTKASVAASLLSFVPYVGNILSSATKTLDSMKTERVQEMRAKLIFDVLPNETIFSEFSMYVARKVTLYKLDVIVNRYLKNQQKKEQKELEKKGKFSQFLNWVSTNVESVTSKAINFVTQIEDYNEPPLKKYARAEALAIFTWYFEYVESKSFNEEYLIRKKDALSHFFYLAMIQECKEPDFLKLKNESEEYERQLRKEEQEVLEKFKDKK